VNRLEDRLRDAFASAAETVRPESVTFLHEQRKPTPKRRFAPLAAAAAVALVIIGASVITPLALAGGHRAPSAPGTAGVPSPSATASPTGAVVITVPLTVGMSQAQAVSVLSAADLNVVCEAQADTAVPAGTVIAQTPAGGSRLVPGATITLTVAAPESSPAPAP
jgi:hypothetical protein